MPSLNGSIAVLQVACGPGDDCAVTLTCDGPSSGGNAATGGSGGSSSQGGSGQGGGQGGSGGGGGAQSTCGNGVVDAGEVCFSEPYVAFETGKNEAHDLVILDCDDDGDLDAVTSDTSSSSITALRNDGNGVLSAPVSTAMTSAEETSSLALGDFETSTSGLEIAVALKAYSWTYVWSVASGCAFNEVRYFYHASSSGNPYSVTAVKMDATSPDDIVVSPDSLSWSLNGGGGVNMGDAGAPAPQGLASADLDDDGDDDVVYVDPNTGRLYWASSVGTELRYFSNNNIELAMGVFDSAIADMDGDSRPDVVVINRDTAMVSVLLHTTNSNQIAFTKLGDYSAAGQGGASETGSRAIVLADIDHDGDVDAITANTSEAAPEGSVSVLLNNGAGALMLATTAAFDNVAVSAPLNVRRRPYAVAVADMNGDDALDIVTAHHFLDGGTAHVSVLLAVP